jgi:hypothetical protein
MPFDRPGMTKGHKLYEIRILQILSTAVQENRLDAVVSENAEARDVSSFNKCCTNVEQILKPHDRGFTCSDKRQLHFLFGRIPSRTIGEVSLPSKNLLFLQAKSFPKAHDCHWNKWNQISAYNQTRTNAVPMEVNNYSAQWSMGRRGKH